MVRISRFPLKEDLLNKLFDLFFNVVGQKNNIKDFKATIVDLLSPTERIMIAKRIAIMYLLLRKIDYVTISDTLKVSPSTVAKFHSIMEKSTGIVPTCSKLLQDEKFKEFLEEIYLNFRGPGTPGVNWSSAWQHKLDLERRKQTGI